jgi:hypothetical protein
LAEKTLTWQQVNEVTWKLTDGRGVNEWAGDRSGSYRRTRAVAWLAGIGKGLWIARYRDQASKPMEAIGGQEVRPRDA